MTHFTRHCRLFLISLLSPRQSYLEGGLQFLYAAGVGDLRQDCQLRHLLPLTQDLRPVLVSSRGGALLVLRSYLAVGSLPFLRMERVARLRGNGSISNELQEKRIHEKHGNVGLRKG